jgi:hypothetical protein
MLEQMTSRARWEAGSHSRRAGFRESGAPAPGGVRWACGASRTAHAVSPLQREARRSGKGRHGSANGARAFGTARELAGRSRANVAL